MAMLNLSKEVYALLKEDAYQNRKTIIEQSQYYIFLGKLFSENPKHHFSELNERALHKAKEFKTTS